MDKQEKEIIGRNWLKNELLKAGIGFATPERDNGIDLIAFKDRGQRQFRAIPLQIKNSTKIHFSIDEKYKVFSDLRIVFVWFILEPDKTEAYSFTYIQLKRIADKLGWTETPTWLTKRKYSNNNPGKKILNLIKPFKLDLASLFK